LHSHPLHNFLSYAHRFSRYHAFVFSVDSHLISKCGSNAMSNPGWGSDGNEMHALEKNGTWKLVPFLVGQKAVRCRWVYTVKLNPDGTLACLKARLLVKGYSKTYGVDYHIWCRLSGHILSSSKNGFSLITYFTGCYTSMDCTPVRY